MAAFKLLTLTFFVLAASVSAQEKSPLLQDPNFEFGIVKFTTLTSNSDLGKVYPPANDRVQRM